MDGIVEALQHGGVVEFGRADPGQPEPAGPEAAPEVAAGVPSVDHSSRPSFSYQVTCTLASGWSWPPTTWSGSWGRCGQEPDLSRAPRTNEPDRCST